MVWKNEDNVHMQCVHRNFIEKIYYPRIMYAAFHNYCTLCRNDNFSCDFIRYYLGESLQRHQSTRSGCIKENLVSLECENPVTR